MSAFKYLRHNQLNFKLCPIDYRHLFYLKLLPCHLWGLENGIYTVLLKAGSDLNKRVIIELVKSGQKHIFVSEEDYPSFQKTHLKNLIEVTRSLSIGDPLQKGKKQMGLLAINMDFLYEDPTNDEILQAQYQCVKNLCHFLMSQNNIHKELYDEFLKQKHHYIQAQPLISSLFLLGILKQTSLFSAKEVESLFLTSFFKDIGMSSIPKHKYEIDKLDSFDKKLFADHSEFSNEILSGRIPLGPDYLNIIKNHHDFSSLKEFGEKNQDTQLLMGFETMMISMMDIVSAMTNDRPYRDSSNLYESLEVVKVLIADKYPREFRLIVYFFKNFFSK